MAYMMKVCGLTERNDAGDARYRYMSGWLNEEMRLVLMPNREKQAADEPDWILYLAPVAIRAAGEGQPAAASP